MNYCTAGMIRECKTPTLVPTSTTFGIHVYPPQTPSILMFVITVLATTEANQAPKKTKGVCGKDKPMFQVHDC